MQKRKAIPQKTKKLIWQEASNMCAFCDNTDVDVLQIHHIIDWAKDGTDEVENLILVCSNCHNKITNGSITTVEVFKAKMNLRSQNALTTPKSNVLKFPSPSNVIQFEKSTNTGIVANNFHINTRNKTVKIEPPQGTIASDRDKRNYVKRLIEIYQDFKKADRNIDKMKYGLIYSAIKREFKCKWDLIPIWRFEELASFLQRRIDNTILGKNYKARGRRNYKTFEEFLLDMRSKKQN